LPQLSAGNEFCGSKSARGRRVSAILVLTTTDSAERAGSLAAILVEERLAACVNVLPAVRSVYRWQGKLCDESEHLLVIKSSREVFERLRARIRALHSYEVPEIVAIELAAGDADYLAWLRQQLD
jgi:periplasmic divalent cation tolerance protein